MKIIVGLGNPGKEYDKTRHNIGFRAVEALRERHADAFDGWKKKFDGLMSTGRIGEEKVVLLLPQTFMNRSGISVQMARAFHKAAPTDAIVVLDEFMLPLGTMRLRANGSGGGHNGMKSILQSVGTQNVPRLRIGIGSSRMDKVPKEDFVLEKFGAKEEKVLAQVLDRAAEALTLAVTEGLDAAMNMANPDPEDTKK
jgi:PTH1 family peptidyl-tRNA hydrolase